MLESFSSKAIATKARAMFGQRLMNGDYAEMMKKSTVGEVAVYLRDNTHYGPALRDMSTESIHRGHLEERLRGVRYEQYAALTRYSFSGETDFYQYLFLWDEIAELIKLLRYISAGSEGEHFPRYSRYLAKYASYDLKVLSVCRDYPSLMQALKGTDYEAILAKYPPREDRDKNQIDMVLCECDLRNYYYQRIFALVRREFSGGAAREIADLFLAEIDTENLADAYRLRRFFRSDPDYIRRALLPYKTASSKLIERIIQCEDDKDLADILAKSRLMRDDHMDDGHIENLTLRERERISRKAMRYSTYPAATLVSYMNQTQIELENVTNIVEGIRYGLEPQEIKKLLILHE